MKRFLVASTAALSPLPAYAHHPLGGMTPASFADGLASGLAHPVIGFDHLAFIVLVGLAAAYVRRPLASVLAFVAATAVGTLLHVGGLVLPLGETVIVISIVMLGAALLSRYRHASPLALLAGSVLAGLFHGWAYGEAVVGAEASPIVAYVLGLASIQFAIAVGVAVLARRAASAVSSADPVADRAGSRLAGPHVAAAVCLGVGLTFLLEGLESALLAAL